MKKLKTLLFATLLSFSVTAQIPCDTIREMQRITEIAVQTEMENEALKMENKDIRTGFFAVVIVAVAELFVIIFKD